MFYFPFEIASQYFCFSKMPAYTNHVAAFSAQILFKIITTTTIIITQNITFTSLAYNTPQSWVVAEGSKLVFLSLPLLHWLKFAKLILFYISFRSSSVNSVTYQTTYK